MSDFTPRAILPITEIMFIRTISVANLRRLDGLTLDADGSDIVLTGANGAGKSSLLLALAGALGQRVAIRPEDFTDRSQPIEVRVVLGGLVPEDQQVFGDRVTLSGAGGAAQLTVGLLARWDEDAEQVEAFSGFPSSSWQRLSKRQREALPVAWLPSWRDPSRLLSLSARDSTLTALLAQLDLGTASSEAAQRLHEAIAALASAPELQKALTDVAAQLGRLLPEVRPDAVALAAGPSRDLWSSLRLAVAHDGPPTDVRIASAGLAQATIFAVLLQQLTERRLIVLVDEPELFLHPSAQRAVVQRLGAAAEQLIVATHSSNVLDRVDVRRIVRLEPIETRVAVRRPTNVDDVEARRYARLIDPRAAEAVFARKLVLLEGPSDRLALLEVCEQLGVDVDARGITLLALDGAGWIGLALRVYGPRGLGVPVLGLVDANREQRWMKALTEAGLAARSREELARHGFFVCDPDLEPVMLDAVGLDAAERLLLDGGAAISPDDGSPRRDRLLAAIKQDRTRWAPTLAAQLPTTAETPLHDLARRL